MQQKTLYLESNFTEAHDWAANTGQRTLERDGQVTFEDALQQWCSFHFELLPIMGDRGKARPKVATDTLQHYLNQNMETDVSDLLAL